jgi:hypothetical protein
VGENTRTNKKTTINHDHKTINYFSMFFQCPTRRMTGHTRIHCWDNGEISITTINNEIAVIQPKRNGNEWKEGR